MEPDIHKVTRTSNLRNFQFKIQCRREWIYLSEALIEKLEASSVWERVTCPFCLMVLPRKIDYRMAVYLAHQGD